MQRDIQAQDQLGDLSPLRADSFGGITVAVVSAQSAPKAGDTVKLAGVKMTVVDVSQARAEGKEKVCSVRLK